MQVHTTIGFVCSTLDGWLREAPSKITSVLSKGLTLAKDQTVYRRGIGVLGCRKLIYPSLFILPIVPLFKGYMDVPRTYRTDTPLLIDGGKWGSRSK